MRKQLHGTHNTELQILEEAYISEMNNLSERWNSKFNEFNDKALRLEEQLLDRQELEMRNCIEYFDTAYPNIKFSSKLLDLRAKEAVLVKKERFIEAHQTLQEADKLEKQEYIKYDKEKYTKLKSYTDKLTNTHKNEKNSLKAKLENEFESMNKKKADEVEILNLNFRKKKFELENQQNSEMLINTNLNKLKSKHVSMRILKNSLSQTSIKNKTINSLEESVKRMNINQLRNKYNSIDRETIFDCISESKESEEEQVICKLNEFGSFSGSDDRALSQ